MMQESPIRFRLLWGLLVLILAGVVGWAILKTQTRPGVGQERPLEGLQVLGEVPDFSLTERSGQKMTRSDLLGKVWVATLIYTRCPDSCPLQMAEMARLQGEFRAEDGLRLVAITVDPERDTPGILSRYADRFGADPLRWLFLTGEKGAISRLVQEGFHLSAVEVPLKRRVNPRASHLHSSRFVLVDRQGRIRGYYSSDDEEALRRLREDMRTLLRGEVS